MFRALTTSIVKLHGVSRTQICRDCRITRTYLYQMEQEKVPVSYRVAFALHKLYGIRQEFILETCRPAYKDELGVAA